MFLEGAGARREILVLLLGGNGDGSERCGRSASGRGGYASCPGATLLGPGLSVFG
jgi:hypothetical protein